MYSSRLYFMCIPLLAFGDVQLVSFVLDEANQSSLKDILLYILKIFIRSTNDSSKTYVQSMYKNAHFKLISKYYKELQKLSPREKIELLKILNCEVQEKNSSPWYFCTYIKCLYESYSNSRQFNTWSCPLSAFMEILWMLIASIDWTV